MNQVLLVIQVSHQPTRVRERGMRRFKSTRDCRDAGDRTNQDAYKEVMVENVWNRFSRQSRASATLLKHTCNGIQSVQSWSTLNLSRVLSFTTTACLYVLEMCSSNLIGIWKRILIDLKV